MTGFVLLDVSVVAFIVVVWIGAAFLRRHEDREDR